MCPSIFESVTAMIARNFNYIGEYDTRKQCDKANTQFNVVTYINVFTLTLDRCKDEGALRLDLSNSNISSLPTCMHHVTHLVEFYLYR